MLKTEMSFMYSQAGTVIIILASKDCIKVWIIFIKISVEKENGLLFEFYVYTDQDSQSSCSYGIILHFLFCLGSYLYL